MRWTSRAAAVLLAAVAHSGCYGWRPATLETLTPGREVRARLTADEARRAAAGMEDGTDLRTIRGVVEEGTDAETLVVSVALQPEGMTGPRRIRRMVPVPSSGIVDLEVSRLQKGRTFALVAVGAVVAAVIVEAALSEDDPASDGEGPGDGPDEIRIPLFSIVW